jgi:hypothetical protein
MAITADQESGAFARIAHSVMRRPVLDVVLVVGVLVALALPFLNVQFGGIDVRVLPADQESRIVSETIGSDFPPSSQGPIVSIVTLPEAVASPAGQAALQSCAGQTAAVSSWGTRGRGIAWRSRSTGWVSSFSKWTAARRTRRDGSWDGGMSFPQPTQYRPRCSTALQCSHDDDMVPPRTGPSPRAGLPGG